jgi:hypothetical protein
MSRKGLVRLGSLVAFVLLAGCNQLAGIEPGEPLGSPIDCEKDSDCPAPAEPECSTFVGCKEGTCAYTHDLDGKVLSSQVAGDCQQRVCDGKGSVRLQAYDADIEDDGNPCTFDTCEGGLPKHTPELEVPCYEGPANTLNVGICKAGIQRCDANHQPIGGCEGQVLPKPESCLTPEDENCDGQKNEGGEGCKCKPLTITSCYTWPAGTEGVGVCQAGTCTCNQAGTGCESFCEGEVVPTAENCATPEDDDCDGRAVDPEDGCVCVANQTDACYSGPPGTEGVGVCAAGTRTCDATGKGYLGPCSGEVLPAALDDCTVAGDEDCDGTSLDVCTGAVGWAKASTSSGSYGAAPMVVSIASDAAGNLYAAGLLSIYGTTIDFGGGPLSPAYSGTSYVAYVVKLAPDGTFLWNKLLPCASTDYDYQAPRLSVAAGRVALAYTISAAGCDFGTGQLEATNGIVLVRLDAAGGDFVSKAVIGSSANTQLHALAATGGAVYLAGFQLDSGTIGSVSISDRPFVAKVDANDTVAWVKGFALSSTNAYDRASSRVAALAALPDGAVAFAGHAAQTTIDVGAGPIGSSASYENHYYGVLEPGGSLRWGKAFSATQGYSSSQYAASALAVTPSGDIIALSRTYQSLTIGSVTLDPEDGYVASLAAASGAMTWTKALHLQSSPDGPLSLSVDALGHIGIGSSLFFGADLGGGPVQTYGAHITKLDGAGVHLWTNHVPLSGNDHPRIAAAKDGGVLFTGTIDGVQSFGGTMVGQQSRREAVFGNLTP